MTYVHRVSRPLAVLLLASLIASCSGSRFDDNTPLAPGDVITAVNERNAKIRALNGSGRISVDTPELANSGGISIKLQKPDTLLLEINGPFGMNVGKGLITDKRFTFYNGLDNTVMQGSTTSKNLRSVLRVSVEFKDILDILSGTTGFTRNPGKAVPKGTRRGDEYELLYDTGDESVEYLVDLKYEAIKKITRRDRRHEVVEEISFRDFRKKSDVYLPFMITVSRPPADENLTLVYDRQAINQLPLDFAFKVPASATKINF